MINENAGYYVCNNQKFDSKVLACIHGQSVGKPVEWIFHNDMFSKFPWHIEPSLTLDQLYDMRAKELREKYDYLIICYSGGVDSHNMIQSFIRQGLHVDEIVSNHITNISKNSITLDTAKRGPENCQAEHNLQTMPRLKEIAKQLPKTKITVIDTSESVDKIFSSEDDVDWIMKRKSVQGMTWTARWNIFNSDEIKRTLDQNKTIALVLGVDKPHTKIKDNNFYISFTDAATHIPLLDWNTNPDINIEFFYWAKEAALLLCKQAHVIRRCVERNRRLEYVWRHRTFETRAIFENLVKDLIYTTWDNSWFQTDKPGKIWLGRESEIWFREQKQGTKDFHIWESGLKYLEEVAGTHLRYRNGIADGFKPIINHYLVGPFVQV